MDNKRKLSRRVKKEISARHEEVYPFGLHPFATASEISKKTTEITRDIKNLNEINGYEMKVLWAYFCQRLKSKAALPLQKNIKKTIRKILFKAVDKAGFIYQAIVGHNDEYISDEYYNNLKSKAGLYTEYLQTKTQNKKKYARACNHLTRACGISSLAKKDGLTPHFLTITLKSCYHRTSHEWNGKTPDQSVGECTAAWSDLYQYLRNNNVNAEYIRMIEADTSGVPHIQATVFTDDPDKFRELLIRVFVDKHKITDPGPHGIYFEETDNAYRSILYTLKSAWPGNDRFEAWKRQLPVRCFSASSNVRSLPSVSLWDAMRKDNFSAKNEITALHRLKSKLKVTNVDELDGQSFVSINGQYHLDIDDAFADTVSRLVKAAMEGDYANFTRIFNDTTSDRKLLSLNKKVGLDTSGSLGNWEVQGITELRTIRQVSDHYGSKIRDIEDLKWLLANKWIGKKSPEKAIAEEKAAKFIKGFINYMNSFKQLEFDFA